MKFMILVYPGPRAEQGVMPDKDAIDVMMKYNEELAAAGVLLDLNGLHPTSKGARVSFDSGKAVVTDGPFTESKEILGGYWIIKVASRQDAINWAMKAPMQADERLEVRQVFDMEDFGPGAVDPDAEKRITEAMAKA